jgi:hypothetical protein
MAYNFGLAPEPKMWGAGPLTFELESGTTTPVLKSGAVPTGQCQAGDEIVLLQFTVSPTGEVTDIKPIDGRDSASFSALAKSLSGWKFTPTSNATGPVPVPAKVLFIKGEDYFRYQVSKRSTIPAVPIHSNRNRLLPLPVRRRSSRSRCP